MTTDPTTKLTPDEAAERIGIPSGGLAKMRLTGDGPAFFKIGRKVVYAVGEVDDWLSQKRVTKTNGGGPGGRPRQNAIPASQRTSA